MAFALFGACAPGMPHLRSNNKQSVFELTYLNHLHRWWHSWRSICWSICTCLVAVDVLVIDDHPSNYHHFSHLHRPKPVSEAEGGTKGTVAMGDAPTLGYHRCHRRNYSTSSLQLCMEPSTDSWLAAAAICLRDIDHQCGPRAAVLLPRASRITKPITPPRRIHIGHRVRTWLYRLRMVFLRLVPGSPLQHTGS